ncbi:C-GCAxxG-C-C family protein [Natranaerofaba carboxydovora]|uniref:C-GCAxxG-C-C family protein n=1 Tax=Natranaerofaba carboxydovora TaxID=2742683 RepID=UPI001F12D14D|nr:C-GCAxxG-C-C family protein [Natranaerofaba carboxydovora]UMZ73432.1 Putative redox-active protein (C_GCAxxG_C_C) [Natranaerofaba carboxydovora]
MKHEISIEKIKQDAENMYRHGEFYCSEAIVCSIKENIELDLADDAIAMASGFPVGIGTSRCVCGAVSGGVMMLGYFFGRTKKSDPNVNRTLELANELQQSFKDNHKHLCCRILTKDMDLSTGEHMEQCISFTGEIAEKTTNIIVRELELINIDN